MKIIATSNWFRGEVEWLMTLQELRQRDEGDTLFRRVTKEQALKIINGKIRKFTHSWGSDNGHTWMSLTPGPIRKFRDGSIKVGCMLFSAEAVEQVRKWAEPKKVAPRRGRVIK